MNSLGVQNKQRVALA